MVKVSFSMRQAALGRREELFATCIGGLLIVAQDRQVDSCCAVCF